MHFLVHGGWKNAIRAFRQRSVKLFALAGVSATIVVGCSDDDSSAPPVEGDGPAPTSVLECESASAAIPSRTTPVRITVWHPETLAREDLLRTLIGEFESAHPTIDVHLVRVGGGSRMLSLWRSTRPADRPALALFPQQFTQQLADSGQTVAPDRCLAEAVPGILPAITASWSVDGRVQAVPFTVSTPILYYNRKLFTAAGLDPDDPPSDLDELHDTAQRLVDTGVADYGLVLSPGATGPASWMVEQWNAQAGAPTLSPDNGRRGRATRAAWRDGPAVDSLTWFGRMLDDDLLLVVDEAAEGGGDILRSASAESPIGMMLHTCGSLGEIYAGLEGGLFPHIELGIGPLPGPGPGHGSLPGGGALWMRAGLPDTEARAAWQLEAWLASPAVQARWTATTGYVPITRNAVSLEPLRQAWIDRPGLAVAYHAVADLGTDPLDLGMQAGPEPEIMASMAAAFRDVEDGVPAREALARAADTTDALLATYADSTDG